MRVNEAIQQFLSRCQHNRNLSPLTIKAYAIDLAQFRYSLKENHKISEVTKEHLSSFQRFLTNQALSPSSIKRKLACLRAMFKWLELEEHLELNPFHKFQLDIKIPRRLPRNVPTDQLLKLCRSAKRKVTLVKENTRLSDSAEKITSGKSLNDLTALLAVELMLTTGIRVSELSNIQLDHLHLSNKKIKIFGKGSRERFVFLTDAEISALVSSYLSAREITGTNSEYLLVNSRGQPASTQFLRKLVKQLANAASLSIKVTPHMLRHSAACELLDAGLDIRFVQRLLGHSSISTTEIYTHVSDKSLQEKIVKANVRRNFMKK